MSEPYKQIEKELVGVGTYRLSIYPDDTGCEGPREWDNAGTMVCWHSRYNLGDEQPKESARDWMANLSGVIDDIPEETDDQFKERVRKALNKEYIMLPLFLYDHSGISISTSNGYPFNCPWDAGQVGWIYISKKNALKEWGKKRYTKAVEAKAVKCLQQEVKTYNQYLTGDVYGFVIEKKEVCDKGHTHWEHLDSCWGFYGSDFKESGMMDHWSDEMKKLFVEAL